MLMLFLDKVLGRVLDRSFREEALGDLWQANHDMRCEGKHRLYRGLVVSWRSILLIYASIQITRYNSRESALLNLNFSCSRVSGVLITAIAVSLILGCSPMVWFQQLVLPSAFRDEQSEVSYSFPPSLEL